MCMRGVILVQIGFETLLYSSVWKKDNGIRTHFINKGIFPVKESILPIVLYW